MALYNPPQLHNGAVNSIFNSADFQYTNLSTQLNQASADARYLQLAGGTVTGNTAFTKAVSVPAISLSSNSISQTAGQVGYPQSFTSAYANASINNGTITGGSFMTLQLPAGVHIVEYYYAILCDASVTYTRVQHGLSTSTTTFNRPQNTNSSYASETMATGRVKYISGTYTVRLSATTNIYSQLLIDFTTTGSMSANIGIFSTREA